MAAVALSLAMPGPIMAGEGAVAGRTVLAAPPEISAALGEVMRQQLSALDGAIASIAAGNFGEAADIAEKGLGITASGRYGGKRFAPYFPEHIRPIGGKTHQAGSRLAEVLREAELMQEKADAYPRIFGALGEVVRGCETCHSAFGFR